LEKIQTASVLKCPFTCQTPPSGVQCGRWCRWPLHGVS